MKFSHTPTIVFAILIALTATLPLHAQSEKAKKIENKSLTALRTLTSKNVAARELVAKADSVLVFPEIIKGGFVVGAQTGNGALIRNGKAVAFYNTTAASYGLQAGVQKYGYALVIMNAKALTSLNKSGGWEVGSAPSLVVVDEGASGSLNTTTIKDGVYAFFFNQKGLMAGLSLQGSKVSQINP